MRNVVDVEAEEGREEVFAGVVQVREVVVRLDLLVVRLVMPFEHSKCLPLGSRCMRFWRY